MVVLHVAVFCDLRKPEVASSGRKGHVATCRTSKPILFLTGMQPVANWDE